MGSYNYTLKHRNYSLDLIRCIAIIFVICIHSMGALEATIISSSIFNTNRIVYIFLSSFIHMGVPLFTMLSGALLLNKHDELGYFLKRRFKRIIIPFFIWSIIVFTLDKVTTHQPSSFILSINEFITKFLTNGVHGIYWYIYMLIGLYLLTPLLQKIFKDISSSLLHYLILLLTLLIIIQYTLPSTYTEKILLLKYLFPYLIYLGYYIYGYYFYRHVSKLFHFQRITILGFLIFYILGILNKILPFTTFPLYFFQSLFFFGILISLKKETSPNNNTLITFISNTSYGIYLSHFLFISFMYKIGIQQAIPLYIGPIFITLAVLCLELCLQYGIRYLKLEKLLQ